MSAVAEKRVTWTAADLTFDPETHTSRLPDGRLVPHVTTILEAVRVTADFESLKAMSGRKAQAITLAGARGHAVHADCHAYDDDDLVWESVHHQVRPYVDAWAQCRMDKNLVPLVRERQVYHAGYDYTGILDGFFQYGRKVVLIDLKTGNPKSAAAHLQTAAYEAAALQSEHIKDRILPMADIDPLKGKIAHERWAVWLRPGRTVPYDIVNYSAWPDAASHFAKFCACLTVYREQPGRTWG